MVADQPEGRLVKMVEMVVLVTLLMLGAGALIITIGLVLRNYWRKRASARRAAPLLLNHSRAITAVETISNTPVPNTPEPYNAPSTASNTPRLTDPYQQAGEEVLSGKVDAAIWARALVEGAGNDGAVKAAYVKLRVAQLNAARGDV